ncbi:hypothetical protein ACFE04_010363 [Oxalis oulophora]
MESVPDLQNSMYLVVDGYPCVRLLNLTGEIGCSNPGRDKIVAPVVRFKNVNKKTQPSAILVSSDEIQDFFGRLSNDSSFAAKVSGVLVESGTANLNNLEGFSPDKKFPQAEFSPYQSNNYKWNPIGSGILWEAYDFPVFLLSESSTLTLQEAAAKNEKTKTGYTADVAEFDLVMQTTKVETRDSESCLNELSCLPLGGYSVWSSLPPINLSSSDQSKPHILTVASMDSASFFRDKNLGADSPISGLIALLAAVDALSHVNDLDNLSKQLVFLVFTGEAWGYLGSRRFLHELDLQSDAVRGLNSSLIEMVMEIGSVGKGHNQGANTFFTHTTEVSTATNKTLDALKSAQESLKTESINILSADASNPGIPPSSMMAFLKKDSLTSGVVLEEFDRGFTNRFYHSHLDDISNVNSSSIVAAASLIARSLYILANNKTVSSSALSTVNVNSSLVEELMSCLLSCDPGMSCELVKKYISVSNTCPSHYVGVISGEPSSTPDNAYVDSVSRFIWNFLADKTSVTMEKPSSACAPDCVNNGGVCIKEETDGKGVCVTSTTRYVPSYSTRLKYEADKWTVLPPNSSDPMGMVDPVWTESNWEVIGLRVYTKQDASYDHLVLVAGILVTFFSYIAIVITRQVITKASKRD